MGFDASYLVLDSMERELRKVGIELATYPFATLGAELGISCRSDHDSSGYRGALERVRTARRADVLHCSNVTQK